MLRVQDLVLGFKGLGFRAQRVQDFERRFYNLSDRQDSVLREL